MQPYNTTEPTGPGSFGFALNVILPASATVIPTFSQNSKRMERDFVLKSITSYQTGNFSVILGTQLFDWFADYVWYQTVFGNAVLPHFIPGEGQFVPKGDFIVAKTINETEAINQITMLFEGIYL